MTMRLNDMKPAQGARKARLRVGRGASAGQGKTCGRGVKGQRARKGGYHKVGFEGGQMPLQRRLPKVGFRSKKAHEVAEVLLYQLDSLKGDVVDFDSLKAAGLVETRAERVKIVKKGEIKRALKLKGVAVTAGAKAAIEAAGGSVE
jgi:large subunit ribosomal protein L15